MKLKKLLIPLIVFVLFIFLHSSVSASRGCCSWHGGVSHCDSTVGFYVCVDGSYSPSCTCWKNQYTSVSPTDTLIPTIEPTEEPTATPTPTPITTVLAASTGQSNSIWFGYLASLGVVGLALICIYLVTKKKGKAHKDWGQQFVDALNQPTLQEHQETKKEKPQRFKFLASLLEKHLAYFTAVWYISFGIGMFYGFIRLLAVIFNAIRAGDFAGFALTIIFNSVLVMLWGFLGGIVIFVVLFIITFLPYLIVRGFAK